MVTMLLIAVCWCETIEVVSVEETTTITETTITGESGEVVIEEVKLLTMEEITVFPVSSMIYQYILSCSNQVSDSGQRAAKTSEEERSCLQRML